MLIQQKYVLTLFQSDWVGKAAGGGNIECGNIIELFLADIFAEKFVIEACRK